MRRRHDLEPVPIRGNIDTRLRKVEAGELDGILLAAAGLARLGWSDRATERFDTDVMVPAPGQETNTVVSVLQKGYSIAERVLRPALVTVAGGQ